MPTTTRPLDAMRRPADTRPYILNGFNRLHARLAIGVFTYTEFDCGPLPDIKVSKRLKLLTAFENLVSPSLQVVSRGSLHVRR